MGWVVILCGRRISSRNSSLCWNVSKSPKRCLLFRLSTKKVLKKPEKLAILGVRSSCRVAYGRKCSHCHQQRIGRVVRGKINHCVEHSLFCRVYQEEDILGAREFVGFRSGAGNGQSEHSEQSTTRSPALLRFHEHSQQSRPFLWCQSFTFTCNVQISDWLFGSGHIWIYVNKERLLHFYKYVCLQNSSTVYLLKVLCMNFLLF